MTRKKLKTIQKKKISKECWNLDLSFFKWLNERLPIYLKEASRILNLDFYNFEIDGKKYTQRQIIEMMIDDVQFLITEDAWAKDYNKTLNHLLLCWSKVLPAMCW